FLSTTFVCYFPIYICMILFSYTSAHPSSFLSFPTRRSSDLCPIFSSSSDTFLYLLSHLICLPRFKSGAISKLGTFRFLSVGLTKDRKSTRLNSSHVSISYAVFCLKKNINQTYFGTISKSRV